MRTRWIVTVSGMAVLATAGALLLAGTRETTLQYRLAAVEQGDISSTVSAAGTLAAVTTVQVGAQVTGKIENLQADFNTAVRANQVIARIENANFKASVEEADAALKVAQADVSMQQAARARAKADLDNTQQALASASADRSKAEVAVRSAERNLRRQQDLRKGNIATQNQLDDAADALASRQAELEAARAQEQAQRSSVASRQAALRMADSQVVNSKAQVLQRTAALSRARINLDYTVIRSPVDGVVVERSVDVGQTVSASLQAPTLFTIAEDLRRMQVETNIDEADIGRIRVGQQAAFTVDAFPGEEFHGNVTQIRKAPKVIQNVVTYSVIISADNPDLRLLPGMTADTRIAVDTRRNTLKVPNAALRFRPLTPQAVSGGAPQVETEGESGANDRTSVDTRVARLAKALELNADQQAQARQVFETGVARIRELRQREASAEEIAAERKRLREEGQRSIAALLTPEQQEKYKAIMARRATRAYVQGEVWMPQGGSALQRIAVQVGISDDRFTEVRSSELQPGAQLVVGYANLPAPATRSRFGFGF